MNDPLEPKHVISDKDAETMASLWVCSMVSSYSDDILTVCADCHHPIVHRPHAAKAAKKVCMPCARIRLGLDKRPREICITESVLRDVVNKNFRED